MNINRTRPNPGLPDLEAGVFDGGMGNIFNLNTRDVFDTTFKSSGITNLLGELNVTRNDSELFSSLTSDLKQKF